MRRPKNKTGGPPKTAIHQRNLFIQTTRPDEQTTVRNENHQRKLRELQGNQLQHKELHIHTSQNVKHCSL